MYDCEGQMVQVGDRILFVHRVSMIRGRVARVNRKTVNVEAQGGMRTYSKRPEQIYRLPLPERQGELFK